MKPIIAVLLALICLLVGTEICNGARLEGGQMPPPKKLGEVPIIYAQPNLQGPARAIERDFSGHSDWAGRSPRIRSIRVPPGWHLVLYSQRNFRGRSHKLSSSWTPQPRDYSKGIDKPLRFVRTKP